MRRRVVGVETEHGLMAARPSGDAAVEPEQAARYLFEPLVKRGRSSNMFLRNGGRLYLDVGAHPEYATAECDLLGDLLIQDRAGTQMLANMAAQGSAQMQAEGLDATIHLFRNNLDAQGNSCGCHENYLLHRRRDFHEVADALVTFFITRQILVGSGHVEHAEGKAPRFVFSQRADQTWDSISSATTRSRPIINTRDEPLADSGAYRRMHVIVGDTNMAEPTTALKIGATELLLSAVEDGLRIQDLALADPMRAIREISQDLTCTLPVELADGRSMTPVEIQTEIMHRVLDRTDPFELDETHLYVIDLWKRGLDAMRSGDWSGVVTELDVAVKRHLLESYCQKSGASLDDPRVQRLELAYHDITGAPLRERMESAGLMKRLTTAADVQEGLTKPPRTTRAYLRGRLVAAAEDTRRDVTVDWVHVRLDDHTVAPITLQDPLSASDDRVEAMIRILFEEAPTLPA